MRRHLAIAAALALALLIGAAAAHGELSQSGDLRLSFKGNFSPRSLPRQRRAPITVHVAGAISTTNGSTPPALRQVEIDLNGHGRLSSVGLPSCTSSLLQSTTTRVALERCRPALVGRGRFGFSVNFPTASPVPAQGRMLAFNGRQNGRPALLLHLYITVPIRATFVFPLTISHRGKGQFGTTLTANIPTLANGVGAVTEIDLKISRQYTYRGRRRSYLSANCAAPDGFPGVVFPLARGSFYFADGRKLETTLSRNCRVS